MRARQERTPSTVAGAGTHMWQPSRSRSRGALVPAGKGTKIASVSGANEPYIPSAEAVEFLAHGYSAANALNFKKTPCSDAKSRIAGGRCRGAGSNGDATPRLKPASLEVKYRENIVDECCLGIANHRSRDNCLTVSTLSSHVSAGTAEGGSPLEHVGSNPDTNLAGANATHRSSRHGRFSPGWRGIRR